MEVRHGLAGRHAEIHPNIEAVRAMTLKNGCASLGDGFRNLLLLIPIGFEPRRNVTPRHKKRVAGREWKAIPEADHQATVMEDPFGVRGAEGARGIAHTTRLTWPVQRPDQTI